MCDDAIMPSVYTKSQPVARKAHRCMECGAAIPKGTKYERATGLYDGEFMDYKTCLECVELKDLLDETCHLALDECVVNSAPFYEERVAFAVAQYELRSAPPSAPGAGEGEVGA